MNDAINNRYLVVDGSDTGHCCFRFTVVDTLKPNMANGKQMEIDGKLYYDAICETFNREEADMVANALNGIGNE